MDFLFFADLAVVRDMGRPNIRRDMEQSHLKLEPSLICAALAAATSKIGLMPTMSTHLPPALQPCPAAGVDRPHQQRPHGLEPGHQHRLVKRLRISARAPL